MSDQLKRRLGRLRESASINCLAEIGHGIEKESLRVDPNGHIAQTTHPAGLGSSLTHSSITTDFSEALLEFITPVFHSSADSLAFLEDLHSYTYKQMDAEEILWISSMPCILEEDDNIPLARYGSSNIGKLKTLYRMGLGHRYGRAMQTIAGIHYNFSLSDRFWSHYGELTESSLNLQDFKTEQYFNLIRNFRRYSWLLIYLFGASPAVCKSFLRGNTNHELEEFRPGTLYAPFGTSLRMGDLGYTSQAQVSLFISYNSLAEYTGGLDQAIKTPYGPYEQFGPEAGSYKQLNNNVLQIENEFYSTIRPKREAPSGTRPVHVLRDQGVEYIEVRCLDLNPFLPVGIDEQQIHFLNSFLIFCLLRNSPPSNKGEYQEIEKNLAAVVNRGRDPNLLLRQQGEEIPLREWAGEILGEVAEIAEVLDTIEDGSLNTQATQAQRNKVADAALTPSAKVLARMEQMNASYFRFAMDQSLACSDYFRGRHLSAEKLAQMQEQSEQSNIDRRLIEESDTQDFDTFLKIMNDN